MTQRVERAEFVVVGAGLLGLAAAWALHRRGREVLVLERARVGHRRGGSHGPVRIFRLGYPDPMYVRMAIAARDLWRGLEATTGRTLLDVTGQASFGAGADEVAAAMESAGAPAHRLTLDEAKRAFPDIAVDGPVLFEPESGVLHADACLDALRAGAAFELREQSPVHGIVDDGRRVIVETSDATIHADTAVVCAGPWTGALLPNDGLRNTFVTLEHVAYVRHENGALPDMPIFIAYGRPAAYGLPTATLGWYKIALHHAGRRADPDGDLEPSPDAVAALAATTRRWLPRFDPEPELVETCLYDNTPDEHFVVDRVGRIVVGAGTSGHGFKFGPLFGEVLADLASGNEPRIALGAFSLHRDVLSR